MTLLKQYNLLENKKVIFWINLASFPLFFFFILFFSLLIVIISGESDFGFSFNWRETSFMVYLFVLMIFFFLIILHELIHGLFFKVFNKEAKVRFGFKNGFAYATSPDSFYTKGQFIWICLAPFILISSALIILVALDFIPILFFIPVASMHAASCVGDFYWVLILVLKPKTIRVQDTESGMSVYLIDEQKKPFNEI